MLERINHFARQPCGVVVLSKVGEALSGTVHSEADPRVRGSAVIGGFLSVCVRVCCHEDIVKRYCEI